jgi:hypothetical protein
LLENRQISKKVPSKEESHYNTIIYNITIKEFKKATKKLWPLFWPARLSLIPNRHLPRVYYLYDYDSV